MEGLYLHMLVYKTLFTERHGIRLYVLLGWGKGLNPKLIYDVWLLTHVSPTSFLWDIGKQYSSRCDAASHLGLFYLLRKKSLKN